MVTEIVEGGPDQLKAKLDALIAAGKTIHHIVVTSRRGVYIIIRTT